MAYEQKTKPTDHSVIEYIEAVNSASKKADAYRLLDIFTGITGYEAKLWGPSMIGFGSYEYTYDSGHSGTAPLVAFSPRKAKISLYFATGLDVREQLLQQFGKYTAGKGCVYINKISDIDEEVLKQFIIESVRFLNETYSSK